MIVLIGASASGKTEVAKMLIKKFEFSKIVTYTTRPKRINEVEDVDYHFVSKTKFEELKSKNFFLETTTYHNNYYGTPINEIAVNKVLIVEPKGFQALKKLNDPSIVSFYIIDTEENRRAHMLARGDSAESVEERIINDRKDFSFANIGTTTFVIEGAGVTISELTDEIYNKYISKVQIFEN